jgi:hypothetical protein
MANTFTNLVKAAYKGFDVVSRELVGFINSVTLDADAAGIPVGQTLYSFETPKVAAGNITPAVTPPDDGDQVIGSKSLTITNVRRVPFRWTGEEAAAINTGAGSEAVRQGQLQQAIRTICNEMEAMVYLTAAAGASRAFGTAGTTPFPTDLSGAAQVRKILDDNGAPGARSLIINTAAGLQLRTQTQLTKANEAGTTMTLRDGELLDLFGFSIKESGGMSVIVKGTGTSYTSSAAGFAIGTTSIPVITGSGTILAGDVITFAGDTNKYVVKTGVAAPGTIVLQDPGLLVALPASATALTIGGNFTANLGFSQTAIVLAARTPYVGEGELAINEEIITDPRSGISLRLAQYANYYRTQYEVSAAWGCTVFNGDHVAMLLG